MLLHKIDHPLKGRVAIDELTFNEALLISTSIPALGSVKTRLLLNQFGSPHGVLQADPAQIAGLAGFGAKIAEGLRNWQKSSSWAHNLSLVAQEKVELLSYVDDDYPKRLFDLVDYPLLLYAKGHIVPRDQRCIAIVGTRQASIYGNEMAARFARELACYGFTVVSGLARGIDTAAHCGALEQGRTLAVIGSGLSDIYPTENRSLAAKIAEQGALLSEFPMATPPDRQNFPQRNRIVAALSMAVLLVEAPLKSGAMLTVGRSHDLGRAIFVLPGRVDSVNFRGNHALIKEGQGCLVENAEEIAASLDSLFSSSRPAAPSLGQPVTIALDKEEEKLLHLLPNEEISIEEIIGLSRLPIDKLHVLLMSLILKRAIKEFPGKVYKKIWLNRKSP